MFDLFINFLISRLGDQEDNLWFQYFYVIFLSITDLPWHPCSQPLAVTSTGLWGSYDPGRWRLLAASRRRRSRGRGSEWSQCWAAISCVLCTVYCVLHMYCVLYTDTVHCVLYTIYWYCTLHWVLCSCSIVLPYSWYWMFRPCSSPLPDLEIPPLLTPWLDSCSSASDSWT